MRLHGASDGLRALTCHAAKRGERGQGMVEYALVVVFITIVVVVSLTVVGNQLSNIFSNVTLQLGP
jgi:pilus assembly protein Flp/PilA